MDDEQRKNEAFSAGTRGAAEIGGYNSAEMDAYNAGRSHYDLDQQLNKSGGASDQNQSFVPYSGGGATSSGANPVAVGVGAAGLLSAYGGCTTWLGTFGVMAIFAEALFFIFFFMTVVFNETHSWSGIWLGLAFAVALLVGFKIKPIERIVKFAAQLAIPVIFVKYFFFGNFLKSFKDINYLSPTVIIITLLCTVVPFVGLHFLFNGALRDIDVLHQESRARKAEKDFRYRFSDRRGKILEKKRGYQEKSWGGERSDTGTPAVRKFTQTRAMYDVAWDDGRVSLEQLDGELSPGDPIALVRDKWHTVGCVNLRTGKFSVEPYDYVTSAFFWIVLSVFTLFIAGLGIFIFIFYKVKEKRRLAKNRRKVAEYVNAMKF